MKYVFVLYRLWRYNITEGCAARSSTLRSNPSHLTDLNLSNNNLGVELLSTVLDNSYSKVNYMIQYMNRMSCGNNYNDGEL